MVKGTVKILVTLLVAAVVVFALALGAIRHCASGTMVEQAVTSATGNEKAGKLAGSIMDGKNLSSTDYMEALGIDEKAYAKLEHAAKRAQINLNDSAQLKDIVTANVDKLGDVKRIVGDCVSGKITEKQAGKKLADLLGTGGGQ